MRDGALQIFALTVQCDGAVVCGSFAVTHSHSITHSRTLRDTHSAHSTTTLNYHTFSHTHTSHSLTHSHHSGSLAHSLTHRLFRSHSLTLTLDLLDYLVVGGLVGWLVGSVFVRSIGVMAIV